MRSDLGGAGSRHGDMARRATHRGSDVRQGTRDVVKPDLWPAKPTGPHGWLREITLRWRWRKLGNITEL